MKYQNLAKGPWTQNLAPGPNHFKYECWGPGKSIDTNIVRFCAKIEIFKYGAKGPMDQKFGTGVQITLNMNAGVQASP